MNAKHLLFIATAIVIVSLVSGRTAFEKLTELDYRGNTYYTIRNLSLWECQGWCREEPECAAASFSFVLNPLAPVQETLCLLQNETLASNPSAEPQRAVSLYYMVKLSVRSDKVCNRPWTFERVPNKMIRGLDNALIFTSNKEACLAACLNEKRFTCRSCEYNYVTLQCHLSEHDRRSVDETVEIVEVQGVDYFENLCLSGSKSCKEERGYAEPSLGVPADRISHYVSLHYYVDKELMANTVAACERACEIESEFLCRSFQYKGPPSGSSYNCQLFHLDHYILPDGPSTYLSTDRPLLDNGDRTGKYYENVCKDLTQKPTTKLICKQATTKDKRYITQIMCFDKAFLGRDVDLDEISDDIASDSSTGDGGSSGSSSTSSGGYDGYGSTGVGGTQSGSQTGSESGIQSALTGSQNLGSQSGSQGVQTGSLSGSQTGDLGGGQTGDPGTSESQTGGVSGSQTGGVIGGQTGGMAGSLTESQLTGQLGGYNLSGLIGSGMMGTTMSGGMLDALFGGGSSQYSSSSVWGGGFPTQPTSQLPDFSGKEDVNCDPTGVCYDVHCKDTRIVVRVSTTRPFNGRIYALGRSETCNVDVISSDEFRLDLTMEGQDCNTQSIGGVYTNTVVIQHHSVVMTKTDKIYKVRCTYDMSSKNITFGMMPIRDPAMIPITSAPEAPPPRIRILDATLKEVETVRIGDRLTFRIEIPEETPYAIFARSCVAMAKDSRSTFQIIDDNGCPVEPGIFPHFVKSGMALQAVYEAFRFTESYGVIFQCNVKYCLGECEPANCPTGAGYVKSFGRKKRGLRSSQTQGIQGDIQETTKEDVLIDEHGKKQSDDEMSISQEILVLDLGDEQSPQYKKQSKQSVEENFYSNTTVKIDHPQVTLFETCPTRSSVLALAVTCAILLLIYVLTVFYFVMRKWSTPTKHIH